MVFLVQSFSETMTNLPSYLRYFKISVMPGKYNFVHIYHIYLTNRQASKSKKIAL